MAFPSAAQGYIIRERSVYNSKLNVLVTCPSILARERERKRVWCRKPPITSLNVVSRTAANPYNKLLRASTACPVVCNNSCGWVGYIT